MKKQNLTKNAYKNPEFLSSDEARSLRILSEYLEPLSRLDKYKINNTVLFFGSSRVKNDEKKHPLAKYYKEAEELAYHLAKWAIKLKQKGKNFVICTGGGLGIMEAANRGASRGGAKSIGMNISLQKPQPLNPYISPELSFIFHYFFMRKFWLVNRAKAIVAFPGGFGTLDEVFELLTLTQTRKITKDNIVPVLLYGKEYWEEIINFNSLFKYKAISRKDLNLFTYCSSPEEAFLFLKKRLTEFL